MSHDATLSPAPETLPLAELSARLWVVLGGLRHVIAAWGGRDRAAVPLVVLIWGRVGRIAQRFEALLKRLAAGPLPPPRLRTPSPTRTAPLTPRVRLPRGHAWLVRLLQESVAFGSQLQALLDDPAMAALLATCPRAARILRPLHPMLGLTKPGAPLRTPKPKRSWWHAPPPPLAPPDPSGPVLFPTGRPPSGWPH